MSPMATGNPVYLRTGAKVESVVDLAIPCPGFTWTVGRNYTTLAYSPVGQTAFGTKWFSDDAEMRIWGSYGSQIRLVVSSTSAWTFNFDSGTNSYVAPPDSNLTLTHETYPGTSQNCYVVTNEDTNDVFVFYDFEQYETYGRLRERTTKHRWAQQKLGQSTAGAVYSYNTNGSISSTTLPEPLNYYVKYSYSGSAMPITKIAVYTSYSAFTGSQSPVATVDYKYYTSSSSGLSIALGSDGDLIQVIVRKQDSSQNPSTSDGWIERATQYRYYNSGTDPNNFTTSAPGYLKAVYEHDALQRLIDRRGSCGATLSNALDAILADHDEDTVTGGGKVRDYASRWIKYYRHDEGDGSNTYNTLRNSAEDLESDLGMRNVDEVHEGGLVREEIIGSGCGACGSGEQQLIKRYHYLWQDKGGSSHNYYVNAGHKADANEVTWVVVEDTAKPNPSSNQPPIHLYRKIYGLNDHSRQLREAFIEYSDDPEEEAFRCWAQAWIFAPFASLPRHKDRLSEYRGPACYAIDNLEKLQQFLDPFNDPSNSNSGSGTWDESLILSGAGELFAYEYNDAGYLTGSRVKKGIGGTSYYLSATDYGDGDGDEAGYDHQFKSMAVADHAYPNPTTNRDDSSRITTSYSYEFWDADDRQIKKLKVTLPKVDTAQNGAGMGAPATAFERYFDNQGRLRWTKDGEGYVSYYAYHPNSDGLAYMMVDVDDPSSPGAEITNGDDSGASSTDVKWTDWTRGGANSNKPTRGSSLPTGLGLITKTEFDRLGRTRITIEPGGDQHYMAYQVTGSGCAKVERVIQYPYWAGSSSSGAPLLPIEVTELNNQGKVSKVYALPASSSAVIPGSGGVTGPVGVAETSSSLNYVSLSINSYDATTGQLKHTDRYHKIPAYGALPGALSTNFDRTCHIYDPEGRPAAAIQTVEGADTSSVVQVSFTEHDVLGRVTGTKRWRETALDVRPDYVNYNSIESLAIAKPLLTKTEYDAGGVGAGFVTKTRRYFGTGPNDYVESNFTRTFRGHLRGVHEKNGTASVSPYTVMDVDWLGRQTASAQYTTPPPTWPSEYSNYVHNGNAASPAPVTSGYFDLSVSYYDPPGRVFRTEHYPGASANRLQINNYYDRNDRLVCTGDKYSAHTEYAYDGAGRQYQQRTVKDAPASNAYTSAVFDYTAPKPVPGSTQVGYAMLMLNGNEGIVEMAHRIFNASGNIEQEHQFEVNHNETDGLSVGDEDHVRRSVYHWHDAADRLIATADYGAAEGGPSSTWTHHDIPNRPSSAPTWTDAVVYNGYALLTTYGYDAAGRQNLVTTGVKKSGNNTDKTATKTFYDDLGRRTYVAENWVDFAPGSSPTSPTGVGGGTNNDQDRATGWQYDGLSNVLKLTAYNLGGSVGSADDQITEYVYGDDYHADLVTKTIYPDSSSTTDNVQRAYNLDRSLATMTDQRQVTHTYSYNNRRQLELDAVTGLGSSVDNSVLSIKRTYDGRGRLLDVYSCSDTAGTTVLNRIYYSYQDHSTSSGKLVGMRQYHNATSYQDYWREIDGGNTGGVFVNQARPVWVEYPNKLRVGYERGHTSIFGNPDNIDDRLGRITGIDIDLDGPLTTHTWAEYLGYQSAGVDRLVSVDYEIPQIRRRMYNATTNSNYDAFDRFGRTVRQQWDKYNTGAGVRDQFDYQYDLVGNRLSRAIPSGLTNDRDEAYEYDGLQRLKSMKRGTLSGGTVSGPIDQSWGLDGLGNWVVYSQHSDMGVQIDHIRSHNSVNEITSILEDGGTQFWETPLYDAAGNTTRLPKPANPGDVFQLKYDAWNRVVEVKSGANVVQQNKYDGLHRRIIKEKYVSGTLSETRHYYYNENWQVVEERVGTDPATATVDALYVWHPQYVDSLSIRFWDHDQDNNASTSLVAHYYLQDANYNVTAVASSSGAILERYAYTPYGEVTILNGASDADGAEWSVDANGSDIGNVHLYTGRERDPETGLQLNRNRFYASHLGRWMTRDPIDYDSGGLNLYEYVACWPIESLDPYGLRTVVNPPGGTITGPISGPGQRVPVRQWPGWPGPDYPSKNPIQKPIQKPHPWDIWPDGRDQRPAYWTNPGTPAPQHNALKDIPTGNLKPGCYRYDPYGKPGFPFINQGTLTPAGPGDGIYFPGPPGKDGKCPPCPNNQLPPPQRHDVPGKHGCPTAHWHYFVYEQIPPPSCLCVRQRRFGGCIPPQAGQPSPPPGL
jgi:RHS repeat-associated protein